MPKIFFEGREYDNPEQMTPEARARYEKAAQMLPDRDQNGVPDLLEVEGSGAPVASRPAAGPPDPAVILGPGVSVPSARVRAVTARSSKARKWVLWVVIGIISVCVACFGVFMVVMFSIMRSSEAFKLAMDVTNNHPIAQQVLGVPIEDSPITTGSVNEDGASGSADLEIPVKGPNQSGTLYVTAVKEEDTWRLTSLVLEAGGQQYQLMP